MIVQGLLCLVNIHSKGGKFGLELSYHLADKVDVRLLCNAGHVNLNRCWDVRLLSIATEQVLDLVHGNARLDFWCRWQRSLDVGSIRPANDTVYNHSELIAGQGTLACKLAIGVTDEDLVLSQTLDRLVCPVIVWNILEWTILCEHRSNANTGERHCECADGHRHILHIFPRIQCAIGVTQRVPEMTHRGT